MPSEDDARRGPDDDSSDRQERQAGHRPAAIASAPDGERATHRDGGDGSSRPDLRGRVLALAVALGLFGLALSIGRAVSRSAHAVLAVGPPGTVSRLLVGVVGLQVLGFGTAVALFVATRETEWRAYLRLEDASTWTVFYGTATGLALMLVATLATGLFVLLDLEPARSTVGRATTPGFYLVLFVVSTVVVVPLEELFFRGVVQRHLEDRFHVAVAIGVASLLFTVVHTGTTDGGGGQLVTLAMFAAFGVVLGISYDRTGNLLVPIVGHACFNGVQILLRAIELAV